MSDIALLLVVLLVLLLIFRGPRVLPKLGASFGRGLRDARHAAAERFGRGDDEPGEGAGP